MSKFQIGSVSSGTLRTEDLLPCFANELLERICDLDHITNSTATAQLEQMRRLSKLHDDAEHIAYCLGEGWLNTEGEEAASEILGEIQDALSELAPPYVHFGALDGDGADFGYWPSIEALEEAVRDGEVLKVNAGTDVAADYAGLAMMVTDHGNVTLYQFHGQFSKSPTELWACV